MAATITPTDLNARHSPSGGGRPRYIAAQRTIGVGCTLMKTNKTESALIFFLGVHAARPGKLRARAPARAQTGLLYIGCLPPQVGHRANKSVGERSDPVRDGTSVVLGKSRVLYNSHFR